jgi:hypothetical protein
MFGLKSSLNFSFVEKAISDKDGNINIKSDRYYNTLMIAYLQAKNELVYNNKGLNLLNIKDIEDAYSWSEEFCREFFLADYKVLTDSTLCPWCLLHYSSHCEYDEDPNECTICLACCFDGKEPVYDKIINGGRNCICDIPGMAELYKCYRHLVDSRMRRSSEKVYYSQTDVDFKRIYL